MQRCEKNIRKITKHGRLLNMGPTVGIPYGSSKTSLDYQPSPRAHRSISNLHIKGGSHRWHHSTSTFKQQKSKGNKWGLLLQKAIVEPKAQHPLAYFFTPWESLRVVSLLEQIKSLLSSSRAPHVHAFYYNTHVWLLMPTNCNSSPNSSQKSVLIMSQVQPSFYSSKNKSFYVLVLNVPQNLKNPYLVTY